MIDPKQVHKPNETPILFVNFSDEEFVGFWDKVPYKFAAGESKWLPFWLALHFSKPLADREMGKKKLATDHPSRESFVAKCIGNSPAEQGEKQDPLGIETLNKNMAEKPKKLGRPAKVAIVPKKEPSSEIDDFEGK